MWSDVGEMLAVGTETTSTSDQHEKRCLFFDVSQCAVCEDLVEHVAEPAALPLYERLQGVCCVMWRDL